MAEVVYLRKKISVGFRNATHSSSEVGYRTSSNEIKRIGQMQFIICQNVVASRWLSGHCLRESCTCVHNHAIIPRDPQVKVLSALWRNFAYDHLRLTFHACDLFAYACAPAIATKSHLHRPACLFVLVNVLHAHAIA